MAPNARQEGPQNGYLMVKFVGGNDSHCSNDSHQTVIVMVPASGSCAFILLILM
jgi:hypothetical protein